MRKPFYPQNNARKTVAPQEIYAEGDSNRKQLIPCVHCRCHTRHAPYAAAEKHSGCNPKIDGQAVKYLLPRREDAIIRKRYSEIIIFKGIARGGENVPEFKNRRTEAILFFQEGIARAERQVGDETVMEEMVVPAKTILLNSNAKSYQRADSDGREIFHECIHYEWHTMFFTLQALHSADLRLLEYEEADRASRPAAKDVRWVERQASYGSTAAALPRPVLMPMVHQYWAEVVNQNINPGDKIAHVIYQIAQEKQVSKGLIRTRLIWLGSPAAKGAFNYVNGRYIANFAFDRESVSSGRYVRHQPNTVS